MSKDFKKGLIEEARETVIEAEGDEYEEGSECYDEALQYYEEKKLYARRYYEANREKAKEACRVYSRKIRADPVKREQINAQKREMMRRLSERRRMERGLPARAVRGKDPIGVKKSMRDYKKYYAENIDKMRAANRRYSAKLRADPEKRAVINEKKKLAMRRLKRRRDMEERGMPYFSEDDEPTIITAKKEEEEGEDSQMGSDEFEITAADSTLADHQDYIIEEVIYNTDTADEDQEEEDAHEQEQDQEVIEFNTPTATEDYQETEPEEKIEDVLPETAMILQSLPVDSKAHFITYMERCARNYLP